MFSIKRDELKCYWPFLKKKYVYSPSKHQDFNEKLSECSNNFIPRNVLQNICSEEDLDSLFEEKADIVHFEKSEIEMNTKESMENFNYLPEYNSDYPYVFTLHNLSEKEKNDLRIQATFKRSTCSKVSTFTSIQITTNFQNKLLD